MALHKAALEEPDASGQPVFEDGINIRSAMSGDSNPKISVSGLSDCIRRLSLLSSSSIYPLPGGEGWEPLDWNGDQAMRA
ncbi:MAG TPA: hypothetical protein VGM27_27385 [Acidobacteriaceae bacterium]